MPCRSFAFIIISRENMPKRVDEDEDDGDVSVLPADYMAVLLEALPYHSGDVETDQGRALALSTKE